MLVLDAGAFVAVERGDRDVVALVKRERLAGRSPVTGGGVVAQVWRGAADGRHSLPAFWPASKSHPSMTAWDGEPGCSWPVPACPTPSMPPSCR